MQAGATLAHEIAQDAPEAEFEKGSSSHVLVSNNRDKIQQCKEGAVPAA
jgi:hypothetical protein